MPAVSPARKAAFAILMAVERGHSHSDDLLRGRAVDALSPADRNLATALVLGVLRWQIRLDHQLQALLKRPNAKLDPEVLIALRLGAFQLLHLDRIPARAAIDESVELAKQAGHRFASGMVNAVLRKLSLLRHPDGEAPALKGHGLGRLAALDDLTGHDFSRAADAVKATGALAPEGARSEESPSDLALAESHPHWMVERWASFYGLEAARAICRHGQNQPALTVRLASPSVEAELTQAGIRLEPGELLTAARTIASGDITATAPFSDGRVRLQDEGSQLIAEFICGSGTDLNQEVKRILDCCAAPGGKTLILAECNPQARIVACESSAQRLEQLRRRLAGHAERVECRLADATALTEDSAFDLALADVPCSGTGTLGRNPEIRHRLRPEDLPRQAERQRAILKAALRAVRPGGRVVYSTCSLEPEENEQVVAAVLRETPNARAISLETGIEALLGEGILTASGAERLHRGLTPEGGLRLLPGAFHTDGFFIALMERTETPKVS
jgi:16S rRNA (cytosine967-C5)-methyltransferase